MRFNCRPVGLDFIEAATWRFENVVELEASSAAVFDIFADGESWPLWLKDIKRAVWISPEPVEVGTREGRRGRPSCRHEAPSIPAPLW